MALTACSFFEFGILRFKNVVLDVKELMRTVRDANYLEKESSVQQSRAGYLICGKIIGAETEHKVKKNTRTLNENAFEGKIKHQIPWDQTEYSNGRIPRPRHMRIASVRVIISLHGAATPSGGAKCTVMQADFVV